METGGKRKGDKGYFIEPTIFSNVTEDMKIMQEEIFGPVCSISRFSTKEEAIQLGNKTTYGLAAAVHTLNINTALEVAHALRAGTVWVNTYNTLHHQLPFGGYKESGIGREMGEISLDNYTQVGPAWACVPPVVSRTCADVRANRARLLSSAWAMRFSDDARAGKMATARSPLLASCVDSSVKKSTARASRILLEIQHRLSRFSVLRHSIVKSLSVLRRLVQYNADTAARAGPELRKPPEGLGLKR